MRPMVVEFFAGEAFIQNLRFRSMSKHLTVHQGSVAMITEQKSSGRPHSGGPYVCIKIRISWYGVANHLIIGQFICKTYVLPSFKLTL